MGAASFTAIAKRDAYPAGLRESVERRGYGSVRVLEQAYAAWPDAQTAMEHLGDDDRYENGHMTPDNVGGKHDLVHIATVDDETSAMTMAEELMQRGDSRIQDKRGPAGCITIRGGESQFLFFGFVCT